MDEETRQDGSEGQTDAVSDVADTGEQKAQPEPAIAKEPVGELLAEADAPTDPESAPLAEAVSAPADETSMVSAESAPGEGRASAEDTSASAVAPEVAAKAEAVMSQAAEPVAEDMVEPEQVELVAGEDGESAMGSPAAAAPEVSEAVEAQAEVVAAPAMEMAGQPASGEMQSEAVTAEVSEAEDDRHWYVVHCYSGYENKVRHNLEQRIESMGMKDKIFDVVVPTEEEIEVKEGKRRTVERRVFPGYILVQMIMTEESWYVVRNTPGVTGFVGMGNEPTPLRPEEVAQIIRRMEAEAPRVKVTYKIDQKVRIIDGPFNDFIGTVDDIDMERAKVRVMVSFFGRETPVELDFLQVEKA
jgi:transcriptional antiterminator NusG